MTTDPRPGGSSETHWSFYGQTTNFIGRVKELHQLRETMRNAIDAHRRRAVLVLGEAGIGKTRLVREFIDTVDEHVDKVTVMSAAWHTDGGPPYSVFRDVLRERFYIEIDDPPDVARERLQAGLTQVLRDEATGEMAAHFIGHLVGMRSPRSKHILKVDADPRRIEERAIALLIEVLRADAQRSPLIIAFDNLHLASQESLNLLLKLSLGITDVPVLFVASARQGFAERHRSFVDGLRAVGEVIDLPELSDRECRTIIRSLLERAGKVPDTFLKLACERAFGNPLSLEQIVQLQIERGAVDVTTDPWTVHADRLDDTRIPSLLRDVVRSKLARLAAGERLLLEKAAAIGDVFWSGAVEMLRRADEGEAWDEADRYWNTSRRTEEVQICLEELRRKHIILRSSTTTFPRSREYAFKHGLEREVLYEGIEGPRRARYHRLIAQWLAAREPERAQDHIELMALHWERGHHPRKAARCYVLAGDRARDRYQNRKAAGYYRKALRCLGDDDASVRLEVFHEIGKVYMVIGDHAEALGCFQEMLRLAWLLDDPRQGGLAYNKMGQSYRALGEYELALEHFKNGLALFRSVEDVRGIAASADDIGRVHMLRGDLERAEERFREGLRLRRYLEDERSVAVSLRNVAAVLTEQGDFDQALPVMEEALRLARDTGDRKTEADVLNAQGALRFHRGEFDLALPLWSQALEISRDIGERQLEGVLLNNMGEASLTLGRNDEAREQLDAAIRIFRDVGDRRSLAEALRNQGCVYLRLDDYTRALELSQDALDVALEVGARALAGLAQRNLGEVHSRTLYDDDAGREERIATAAACFERSIQELEAVGLLAELGRSLLAHGAFLAEIGRLDDARGELERARELFARLEMKDGLERTERVLAAL